MGQRIAITVGDVTADAELNDSACALAICDALPLQAVANTWGEEIYFDIGVSCDLADDARRDVGVGELGYWPVGTAFCIFFGRTPASDSSGAPRAASEVNPIGRIVGDASIFALAKDGDPVIISVESLSR